MPGLKQNCKQDCKLTCCRSCTLCNRAVRKQRHKSLSGSNGNKVCETCLLCKSLSLCSNCAKCPSCCRKSICGGPSAKVLAGLALPGCKPKSNFNSSGRVQPTLQRETSSDKVTGNISGYANPVKSKHIKDSLQALIQKQAVEKLTTPSSLAFYNRLFLVPKPNHKWRPILDLSRLNCYLATSSFKMETPETIRVGDVSGFQRRLLPYTHRTKVAEIPQILSPQSSLSVHSSPLWPLNGSVGVHKGGQRSQINFFFFFFFFFFVFFWNAS